MWTPHNRKCFLWLLYFVIMSNFFPKARLYTVNCGLGAKFLETVTKLWCQFCGTVPFVSRSRSLLTKLCNTKFSYTNSWHFFLPLLIPWIALVIKKKYEKAVWFRRKYVFRPRVGFLMQIAENNKNVCLFFAQIFFLLLSGKHVGFKYASMYVKNLLNLSY